MSESLFIGGFGLIVAGVAILSPVAAMIVAGVGLMAGAIAIERGRE
jgi:hypothetical protein